jgi:hypothetical protein
MRATNKSFYSLLVSSFLILTLLSSCEKFVELGPPPTQTIQEDVFKTDATATSAFLVCTVVSHILTWLFRSVVTWACQPTM